MVEGVGLIDIPDKSSVNTKTFLVGNSNEIWDNVEKIHDINIGML